MDTTTPASSTARAPQKKRFPPERIILLSILAIGLVAVGVDYYARGQATSAHQKLEQYLPKEEELDAGSAEVRVLTPDDVHKILNREPSTVEERGRETIETYSWRGALRAYKVQAVYFRSGQTMLTTAILNPEEDAPQEEQQEPAGTGTS